MMEFKTKGKYFELTKTHLYMRDKSQNKCHDIGVTLKALRRAKNVLRANILPLNYGCLYSGMRNIRTFFVIDRDRRTIGCTKFPVLRWNQIMGISQKKARAAGARG